MKIRKKVLSVLCAAMLLGTITSVTVPQVQASDEQTKKVDGSYLTMQESASGTSQNEDAKGQYIMLGECSITKAGRNLTGETGQASVINVEDMDTQASESADETQVYREVKKELGIQAVRIQYKPKGMRLQKYILDKEQRRAQIFYEYKGEVVWYSIYMNAEDSSLGQKESDGIIDEFTIENNMKKINVTEYQVKGYEETGFLAEFEDYGVHYQLRGMMERDELEKVLKNLKFF